MGRYEEELYRFIEARHPAVFSRISEKKILDDETKAAVDAALTEFGQQFGGAKPTGVAA